jgi:hypothetical protein
MQFGRAKKSENLSLHYIYWSERNGASLGPETNPRIDSVVRPDSVCDSQIFGHS